MKCFRLNDAELCVVSSFTVTQDTLPEQDTALHLCLAPFAALRREKKSATCRNTAPPTPFD